MAYRYKWKPSKSANREFAKTMSEIDTYCIDNGISQSNSSDSYYFNHDGVEYRISNHAVERSVSRDGLKYHGDSKVYRDNTYCIHASKTRLIEIHQAIVSGHNVDHHGNII